MITCENVHKAYRTGHGVQEVLKGIRLTLNTG